MARSAPPTAPVAVAAKATRATGDWPLLTSALVVCRECLPAGGGSLPHVTRQIDAFLDTFSRKEALAAACQRGDSVRALFYLFARDPRPFRQEMVRGAARGGHIHALQWLTEHDDGSGEWDLWKDYSFSPMDEAAKFGHFEAVRWLHENIADSHSWRAMNWAAQNGHLELLQWLHDTRQDLCADYAMDFAAANGHLEVVQWLHINRQEGCTTWAMDGAAQNGHLEVMQWLHANRKEGCTEVAIEGAVARGHLEMVRWLLQIARSKDERQWWELARSAAARSDHREITKWLDRDPVDDEVVELASTVAISRDTEEATR